MPRNRAAVREENGQEAEKRAQCIARSGEFEKLLLVKGGLHKKYAVALQMRDLQENVCEQSNFMSYKSIPPTMVKGCETVMDKFGEKFEHELWKCELNQFFYFQLNHFLFSLETRSACTHILLFSDFS